MKPIALFPLMLVATIAEAQRPEASSVNALLDSVVPAALHGEHIPGAVIAVVSGGRVLTIRGYGVADTLTRRPMTDSTIVRIGSISKVMTAVALVQLVDRGRVQLDHDVNEYLRGISVPVSGPYRAPITPWNLLTHTAALDEIRPGTQAESREQVLPLNQFLAQRLIRYAQPGVATAYSTYGITLAGLLVEQVSGVPFERYLVEQVWRPLGMKRTSITIPDEDAALVAVPYDVEDGKVARAPWEWYHTTPASSVNSTASDMAKFMLAQIAGASPIMSARMTREMQRDQITLHPMLPGMGLGWQQISRGEGVSTIPGVQHGGDVAGFASLLTLLPARAFGVFVASHSEGSDLRYVVTRTLLDRFFPVAAPVQPVSMHASSDVAVRAAARYVGHYRANIVCHTCATPPPTTEIDVVGNNDGTVSAFGARFIEVSPRFFRSENGLRRMGFREDSLGRITHLTMGSWQVLERVPMPGAGVDSAAYER